MTYQEPTLFIGIRGIGCQIVALVSDMLDDIKGKRDYIFLKRRVECITSNHVEVVKCYIENGIV